MNKLLNRLLVSKLGWLLLVLLLVAIKFLASLFLARADLTKEKRYTLSKATSGMIASLEDAMQVDVFLRG